MARGGVRSGSRLPAAALTVGVLVTATVAVGCARVSSEVSFPSARAGAAERQSTARQNFETAKNRVEELVKALDLGVGAVVRCGDWIIEIKQREDKPIEFVRAGGQRIAIKPVRE